MTSKATFFYQMPQLTIPTYPIQNTNYHSNKFIFSLPRNKSHFYQNQKLSTA